MSLTLVVLLKKKSGVRFCIYICIFHHFKRVAVENTLRRVAIDCWWATKQHSEGGPTTSDYNAFTLQTGSVTNGRSGGRLGGFRLVASIPSRLTLVMMKKGPSATCVHFPLALAHPTAAFVLLCWTIAALSQHWTYGAMMSSWGWIRLMDDGGHFTSSKKKPVTRYSHFFFFQKAKSVSQ